MVRRRRGRRADTRHFRAELRRQWHATDGAPRRRCGGRGGKDDSRTLADQAAGAHLDTRRRKMKTKTLKQTVIFQNASPRSVYDLLLDSRKHTGLSREKAVISKRVGGKFTAWNGHLSGFNLVLKPGEKIVQAWRATGWWPDHYSIAIFDFQKLARGTKLTFTQIGI